MWEYLQSFPQKNIFYHKLTFITINSSCCYRRCTSIFFVILLTLDSNCYLLDEITKISDH